MRRELRAQEARYSGSRSNRTTSLSTSWPDLLRPPTSWLPRKAVKAWMPTQVGCFRLGPMIIAEVGNTRLRMTSAGMAAGRLIQSERSPLW
jgi:hypothetical protein